MVVEYLIDGSVADLYAFSSQAGRDGFTSPSVLLSELDNFLDYAGV